MIIICNIALDLIFDIWEQEIVELFESFGHRQPFGDRYDIVHPFHMSAQMSAFDYFSTLCA